MVPARGLRGVVGLVLDNPRGGEDAAELALGHFFSLTGDVGWE